MAGRCPVRLLGLQGLSEGRMIVKDEPSVLWTLRHGDDEARWEGRLLPVGLEGRIVCRKVTSHESRGLPEDRHQAISPADPARSWAQRRTAS